MHRTLINYPMKNIIINLIYCVQLIILIRKGDPPQFSFSGGDHNTVEIKSIAIFINIKCDR